MLIAGTIPATAQEKLEIQITRLGVPRTIEVDRDIRELNLSESGLTSLTLPEGLTNLKKLYLYNNELTSLTLPEGLTNLTSLSLYNNQLTNLFLPPDTASRHKRLELFIEDNPWMRIRQLVGMNIEFDVGHEHYGISYYDLPASPKISRVENGLQISWDDGVLQASADVDGPWQDVHLPSPVKLRRLLISSIPAEFFRVRSKEQ